uniref:Metallophosphoesterase domain containing 1 n=1 Tax=Canis lupus familiaris TaxID=9615 RepID=A0A8C0SI82_CANLF
MGAQAAERGLRSLRAGGRMGGGGPGPAAPAASGGGPGRRRGPRRPGRSRARPSSRARRGGRGSGGESAPAPLPAHPARGRAGAGAGAGAGPGPGGGPEGARGAAGRPPALLRSAGPLPRPAARPAAPRCPPRCSPVPAAAGCGARAGRGPRAEAWRARRGPRRAGARGGGGGSERGAGRRREGRRGGSERRGGRGRGRRGAPRPPPPKEESGSHLLPRTRGAAAAAGGAPAPARLPPRSRAPASLRARCCSRPPRPPKRSPGPGSLPYEYKIVIAGNHELTFDQEFMADLIKQDFYYFPSVSKLKPENYENVQSLLTNCIYLQDSEVTVRGFRIYGSPWQPWFYGWGFNLPRGQALLEKWNLIPEGVDILITHGPPLGFLDWVPKKMQRVGCVELLNTVQRRVQPRLHVFGHIHEGYGVMADGTTTYVNASVCTVNYQPVNPPIVIDLPTPRNS